MYEGALHGAYPVMTREAHGADDVDMPLPASLGLRVDPTNATAIAQALLPLLHEPPSQLAPLFHPLVTKALDLPVRFPSVAEALFSSSALHVVASLQAGPSPSSAAATLLPLLLSLLYHLPLARLTIVTRDEVERQDLLSLLSPVWALLAEHGYTNISSDGQAPQYPIRLLSRGAYMLEEEKETSPMTMSLDLSLPVLVLGPGFLYKSAGEAWARPECRGRVRVLHALVPEEEEEEGRGEEEQSCTGQHIRYKGPSVRISSSVGGFEEGRQRRTTCGIFSEDLVGLPASWAVPLIPTTDDDVGMVMRRVCGEERAAMLGLGEKAAGLCRWDGWRSTEEVLGWEPKPGAV